MNGASIPTLLPPLSSLFNSESPLYKSKLPTIQDILASQTPRHIQVSSKTLSLTPYSLSNNKLERFAALGPSLSYSTVALPSSLPKNTVDELLEIKPNQCSSFDREYPFSETAARMASKIRTANSPYKDFAFISHSPATFPSQEPAIDNASLARRKRRRTSPNELAILNQEFFLGSTPGKAKRLEISKKVNMTEKAVQIWFQNRRQSIRRLRACEKEVTELPPTPDTSINSSFSSDTTSDVSQEIQSNQSVLISNSPFTKAIPDLLSPFSNLSSRENTEAYDKKPSIRLPLKLSTSFSSPGKSVQRNSSSSDSGKFPRMALSQIDTNTLVSPKARNANDAQCIQGLLSLKTAAH